MKKRFILVGANPFTGYNGTVTFTGLNVVALADTKEEADAAVKKWYDECGGLLLWIDRLTGRPGEP